MKLYKYLSLELGAKLLQTPMLRLSNQTSLNDPFEFLLTESSSKKVSDILKRSKGNNYSHVDLIDTFWTHGVISLTETNDNLLMWSHYADEHKGMVVGFDVPIERPFDFFLDGQQPEGSHFAKVNYRKYRKFDGDINANNLDTVRLHYMLGKSDEWIYEKEHRFVIPFYCADVLLINSTNELYDKSLEVLGLSKGNLAHVDDMTIIDLRVHEIPKRALFNVWLLSSHNSAIFLKIINPEVIKTVFLGKGIETTSLHNFFKGLPSKEIKDNFFIENEDTISIKNVFQASLDRDRYELKFDARSLSLLDYIR
ncbi:DUF2971 domain-containing protein [Aeromonas dhakensis]|uniref:DUF2971 domain-containing protein n=1 Tax=Aeromonas dhakensis TaxID=196024 RepID=UPI003BA20673